MRLINVLDEVLGQKGKVKVLRALISSSGGLTARGIARKVGLTHWACIKNLRELELSGLVRSEKVGKANLYTLNRDNLVNKELLLPLFKKEKELLKTVLNWIMKQIESKPVSVILFGSVATGKEDVDSDIDLCFVVKDRKEAKKLERELTGISSDLYQQLGKKFSPYILELSVFKKKYEKGVRVIREIVREGILIYGKPISEVIIR